MVLLFLFLFGLIIGSFLNVLILRVNTGETLNGRSRCFSCLHKLAWYDLIPVGSYFSIKGRCRYCRSKISIQYPLVECVTGFLFVLIGYLMLPFDDITTLGLTTSMAQFILVAAFFAILVAISVYDMRHKIIPDQFSLALLCVALVFEFFHFYPTFELRSMLPDVYAALGGFTFFGSLWFVSGGRWMGFGDAKLAFSLGLFLGYPGIFLAILFAFWIGAIFGIAMLFAGKYGRKTEVPFGPFLALGTLIAFVMISTNILADIMAILYPALV